VERTEQFVDTGSSGIAPQQCAGVDDDDDIDYLIAA
jgi:hypothetical protein